MEIPKHLIESIFKEVIVKGHSVRRASNKLLMNGRCPFCHDEARKKSLRFYLYEKNGAFNVDCKNCNYSKSFKNFLKENFPDKLDVIQSLCMDKIRDGTIFNKLPEIIEPEKLPTNEIHEFLVGFFKECCVKLDTPQEHDLKEKLRQHSIKVMTDRFIPESFWKDCYFCFTGNFKWRIILPFINDKGMYYNFQARDVHPKPDQTRKDKKYIFAQFDEVTLPDDKIYNKYLVDRTKLVYVCEGILKSLFLPNSVALCNANVRGARAEEVKKIFPKRIWVLDSPWKDKTGLEATLKLLGDGETCFVMPKEHKDCKDIDELAKKLKVQQIPQELIDANTYYGQSDLCKIKLMSVGTKYR